jgi:hypothetical protein
MAIWEPPGDPRRVLDVVAGDATQARAARGHHVPGDSGPAGAGHRVDGDPAAIGRPVRPPRVCAGQVLLIRPVGPHHEDPGRPVVRPVPVGDPRAIRRPRRVELHGGRRRQPPNVGRVRPHRPDVVRLVGDHDPSRQGSDVDRWSRGGGRCARPHRGVKTVRCRAAAASGQQQEHRGDRQDPACAHTPLTPGTRAAVPSPHPGHGARPATARHLRGSSPGRRNLHLHATPLLLSRPGEDGERKAG